jgi:uncharacterized protein YaaW (UPF0174 family)
MFEKMMMKMVEKRLAKMSEAEIEAMLANVDEKMLQQALANIDPKQLEGMIKDMPKDLQGKLGRITAKLKG